jgi:hypothetical protein
VVRLHRAVHLALLDDLLRLLLEVVAAFGQVRELRDLAWGDFRGLKTGMHDRQAMVVCFEVRDSGCASTFNNPASAYRRMVPGSRRYGSVSAHVRAGTHQLLPCG